jgi:hypothetical protein
LRYLVVLGHVGVEVGLAAEEGALRQFAGQRKAYFDGMLYCACVDAGFAARHSKAGVADIGIGLAHEAVGAAAEELGLALELDVDLKAYANHLFHHSIYESANVTGKAVGVFLRCAIIRASFPS